jgi:NAD(P)-dependent dehydrogenase (short-subunit alcohol dehydrogenase family)
MAEQRFQNLNVVVTGGAGGLGKAIVDAFARQGANVISADIAFADEAAGNPIIPRHIDVTDEASWLTLMDFTDAALGGVDVLVNNAGIYRPNIPFEEMPLDVWRQHLAINADGVFLGCKHAILRMKAKGRGGSIVNMGSGMSITANPSGAAYCASKAAVLMTTRTAAGAAGRYGVRVNAVLPGAVPTEMLMGNMTGEDTERAFLERMEAYSPLGRLASPEDIARAVLFLADPANAAISGIYVPVDGGNMPGA